MTDFRQDLPGPDPDLVEGILGALDADEQNAVLLMYACPMLPVADLTGRYRALGLINERSTLTALGRAVGKRICQRDPEATDPHERPS